MKLLKFYTWNVLFIGVLLTVAAQITDIEFLADNLNVHWEVVENPKTVPENGYLLYKGTLTLTNTGPTDVTGSDWEIYFCSVRLMFPNELRGTRPEFGHLIGTTNIEIYHLNGCLHKLKPTNGFAGFKSSEHVIIPIEAADWSVSRTDIMPRWYVTDESGATVKTIASTSNEELDFVADFDTKEKWTRLMDTDQYEPYSPESRFSRNAAAADLGEPKKRVIPTPVSEDYDDSVRVDVGSGDWVVVYSSEQLKSEAEYLAGQYYRFLFLFSPFPEKYGAEYGTAKWNTDARNISYTPTNRYVLLEIGNVEGNDDGSDEAYSLSVVPATSVISITGSNSSGVFYGIQTLLSLSSLSSEIPKTEIVDYPRFPYRGMHVDVGRNFFGKDDILKLLEVMAMYKLNNFHFHLTDDEGWRLEIDGLPELTEIGAQRCFDLDEDECLISQLGSGPTTHNGGSGYYTKDEYREILTFANERHILVTPEFDMPGHMHAGIKAMEARYNKMGDAEYLLTDFNDTSNYLSVQIFRDNAVNPCIPSTYRFVEKVMEEVIDLHKDIQPLKSFNFGGDEVSHDAWVNSSACNELIADNPELEPDEYTSKNTLLHRYFVKNVSQIAYNMSLDISGWEDGLKFNGSAIERSLLPNDKAYVFAWNNVWEWGDGGKAYEFANEGYKVVIGHATHFYYDHPQEPDPEERGFYWATRFTDIAKSFGYYADDVYENIQETVMGEPLSRDEFCNEEKCETLQEDKRQNIIGIQGHLWSETVRTSEQLEGMIYPRMLAMAERAWHKASWEDVSSCGDNCDSLKSTDWTEFANTLGYKELRRLSEMGINYYVPPPGARVTQEDGNYKLEVNVDLPGQVVVYSVDNWATWQTINQGSPVNMDADTQIHISVRSADLTRPGRSVTLFTGGSISGQCKQIFSWWLIATNLMLLAALLR